MIKKILAVAKWEYLQKVKTKTFIISLVLTPLIIISFSIIPTLLTTQKDTRTKVIGILDESGEYFIGLRDKLEKAQLENGQPNYLVINLLDGKNIPELKLNADKDVLDNKMDGYIYLRKNDDNTLFTEYRSRSLGNFRDIRKFENAINDIRIDKKILSEGIDPEFADFIHNKASINQVKVEEGGKEGKQDFLIVFFTSFIFILLLMMMVIYSGQMLVRSMIEEKSNRLIEVLISSCTSDELLAGKILGLSSLGLTQIFIWSLVGLALLGSAIIPAEAFENILPILVFFILGFLFYTTLFVGIGSIVTTEQEAQQITTYLSLVLVFPVVIAMPAIQNPDFLITKIFSYIPLTIPTVMLLRINIEPIEILDYITTILIMLLSIIIMIKLSAKIFRIGILSFGSRPSLRELISWLKEK